MTKRARKSLVKNIILMLTVALLVVVLALQFTAAPVAPVISGSASAAVSYGDAKVTFREVDDGYIPDEYLLSDSNVASSAKNSSGKTPSPNSEVTVIVSLVGTPMMQYASGLGVSVGDALATSGGNRNVSELKTIRDNAIRGLKQYIIERRYDYSTVLNGFSAVVKYKDIAAIESNPYVHKVIISNQYNAPEAITENYVNVYESGIFDSSNVGYDGTGTVVAVLDTGTDFTHDVFDMELNPDTVAITKDDVAALVPYLAATSLSAAADPETDAPGEEINEDNLYIKTKLPYAYDYADSDTNVYPHNSHGTHVAGIIAGKSDVITGVAVGAQIATFKVFSDYKDGAKTEAILAALNDAVLLGVDAINMSLGTSCGFSREVDEEGMNEVYDSINEAGICLVVAASNDASSANSSTWGNTNLASNPDSGTVGSPGSYTASLAVASVSGVKTRYFMVDDHEVYFAESRLAGKIDANDFVKGMLGEEQTGEFDYVVIPGTGMEINYTGLDVTGKIAVVRRGTSSFQDKVKVAADQGAIGVIVYNNVSGTITMSVGSKEVIPSCFVTADYAAPLVASGTGTVKLSKEYLAGPFMSDFSSWGVLPNLQLTPDITAHGGEIYSAVPGGDMYDRMSGTSMACPNMAGALIIVRQYVKERQTSVADEQSHAYRRSIRDESYSRMMSTATIVRNEEGDPYSPRKQGAGIADISNSINTKAYLTVDGSNKPKLSLGDDPTRSGVYTMKFNLVNVSGDAISYSLSPYVMTESMSIDGRTVAEKAHLFEDTTNTYSVEARNGTATISGNTVSLSGYGEAEITVQIKLSSADKAYLNKYFRNGMYVEGYVCLDSNNADNIDLNIPYVAFYGNWADAPMLDVTEYEVGASAVDDSVTAEEKLTADVYGTLPYAGFVSEFGDDGMGYYGMGAYGFILPTGYEKPATQEKYAALTNNPDGDYLFYGINAGLLRGAKRVDMEIRNSATGELVWSGTDYNARKSRASGGQQVGGMVFIELDIRDLNLPNNSKYTFSMTCYLDWTGKYVENSADIDPSEYTYGNHNTFSFEFTIDDEAPELTDVAVRESKSGGTSRYTLDISAYDNHYIQGYSVYTYKELNKYGNPSDYTSFTNGLIPAETATIKPAYNGTTTFSIDVTNYWKAIQDNDGKLYITFYDYAKNTKSFEVTIKEDQDEEDDLKIAKTRTASERYTVAPNGQIDLKQYLTVTANTFDDVDEADKSYVEGYWAKKLIWESSDEANVTVKDGLVTGVTNDTSATITVRTPNTSVFDPTDTEHCLSFIINVSGTPKENITVTGVKMNPGAIALERGETATITAEIEPYNCTVPTTLNWTSTSSNVEILEVSDDGLSVTVIAKESGSATLRATVAGSRISGYCSVRIKNEFDVYENIYLRSYNGRGGDWTNENGEVEHNVVEIPDDLGVVYIYPQAFLRNEYIEKVIIPEGIQIIMRSAFVLCTNLKEVVLPESLETIEEGAFAGCRNLTKINLGKVKSIGEQAFWECGMETIDLSSCTYLDRMSFYKCKNLKSLDLSRVGTVGGGAFAYCTGLEELVIPQNTTLNSMDKTGGGAFTACTGLKSVTIKSNSVGDYAFAGCSALESVTFENNVETIGWYAFGYCDSLSKVTFKGSVYEISRCAFINDANLSEFTLPDGLTILGRQAFAGCTGLNTIKVSSGALLTDLDVLTFFGGIVYDEKGNSTGYVYTTVSQFVVEQGNKFLSSDDNGVLYDRAKTKLIAFPTYLRVSSFNVPLTVTTIGAGAFSASGMVSSVNLNNVKYIESNAFCYSSVSTITGYNNVEYIGDYAFEASNIEALPFTDNIKYIGDYAFANTDITGVLSIPAKLEHLGEGAFGGSDITAVSFANSTLKSVGAMAFAQCESLTTIVDYGCLEELSDEMFAGCTALKRVVIPDSIESIGAGVFAQCSNLESVTLPAKLTEIPDAAFVIEPVEAEEQARATRRGLLSITLPDSVTSIGAYAFSGTSITSIDLKNVTEIGEGAFSNTRLASVSSDKVTYVDDYAFADCKLLAIVELENAKYVGKGAFANDEVLTVADISNATTVGESAFAECPELSELIMNKAETIGAGAFYGAKRLTEVDLSHVVSIGTGAFEGAVITEIELSATVSSIADGAFFGMKELTAINVAEANNKYMSRDGVLYIVNDDNLYILISYPAGKTDTEYSVLDRTIKLGAYAFNENEYLEVLTLPVYMQVIGVSAMSGMTSLKQLIINAPSAPTLESRAILVTVEDDETDSEGVDTHDGEGDNDGDDENDDEDTDEDEYDVQGPTVLFVNSYNNFNFAYDADPSLKTLKIIIPANSTGYNNRIWTAYVGDCIEKSQTIHVTSGALDFIKRVEALPEQNELTRENEAEINALMRMYRVLDNSQRMILSGDYSYTGEGDVAVDTDFYQALLKDKNYYSILVAAQEHVQSLPELVDPEPSVDPIDPINPEPPTPPTGEVTEPGISDGNASNNTWLLVVLIIALVLVCAVLAYAVIEYLKRRGSK